MRKQLLRFAFASAFLAGAPLGAAVTDVGFLTTPTRVLNPGAQQATNNRSVYNQGAGTGRTTWTVSGNGTVFDEEIVNNKAHTGSQALHVSNWYTSGIINSIASPWLTTPAGETNSKDTGGNGTTAGANQFHAEFSFTTAGTTNPTNYSWVSISPDDGTGSRWGGQIGIEDSPDGEDGFMFFWDSANRRNGGESNAAYSPVLNRGEWYRAVLDIQFVDGHAVGDPNDVVSISLYGSSNNLVWHADSSTPYQGYFKKSGVFVTYPGITTWEDAGYSSVQAINSLQFHMEYDYQFDDPEGYSSLANRPPGFLFDDFLIQSRSGSTFANSTVVSEYFTSFEAVPEPCTALLLSAGAVFVALRHNRTPSNKNSWQTGTSG